jgi:hypothetical protein
VQTRNGNHSTTTEYINYQRARRTDAEPIIREVITIIGSFFMEVITTVIEYKNNTRFAGAMFLLAIVTSLVGGFMIQGVIDKTDLIEVVADGKQTIIFGVALELINALAVVGIFTALWKPLRRQAPKSALAYVGIRIFEATACIVAAIIPVVLISVVNNADMVLAENLIAARELIINLAVPLFFSVGALLLYGLLYGLRLIPKYISIWGIVATIGIILTTFVPIVELHPILGLPIILNEIYLGIYLIVKGFHATESAEENS